MAEQDTCECQGIRLFRQVVDKTFGALYSPGDPWVSKTALEVATNTYNHLFTQANKPGNMTLHNEAMEQFDAMRNGFGKFQDKGVLALEVVRDAIHKSPALQQLLVCGGPGKRKASADIIGKVCEMLAGDDDEIDKAVPTLTKLFKDIPCKPLYSLYD
jgi:hypothetical protein